MRFRSRRNTVVGVRAYRAFRLVILAFWKVIFSSVVRSLMCFPNPPSRAPIHD
jgi:hypothetical protein